ncbi:hypothetical protein R6Q57_001893 [Mikania cordata]
MDTKSSKRKTRLDRSRKRDILLNLKNDVDDIGFSSIKDFKIKAIPSCLAYWLLYNYDSASNMLNLGSERIKITPGLVCQTLGIPIGKLQLEEKKKPSLSDPVVAEFRQQFQGLNGILTIKTIIDLVKCSAIEIVDNIKGRLHARCAANVRKVQKIVALYLEKESPALHKKIVNLKPKKLEMPWQTENNFVDCGIFAMRHMETYKAKEMKEWKEDCGILEESSGKQHDQLLDLRLKYLSKILLSDINILYDEVTKEVKKFEELDEEVKKQMRRIAHKRIQKRKTQD